jgi:predicted ATPase
MSPINFNNLPLEYQPLLTLVKKKYNLDVIPLQELKGGRTGAFLYLVSITTGDLHKVEHLVVKFDHVSDKTKQSEVGRHRLALSQAPAIFAKQNMAELAYEVEQEGAIALFYTVAGQSLQRFRTLASLERQSRLEVLLSATNDYLLKEWNADASFEQALHPKKLLERWLGYRLNPDGYIASLLRDTFLLDPSIEGFVIQGQIYPNPLSFGLNIDHWKDSRAIDALIGFQHGDLNIGNILVKFSGDSEVLAGYFLIDFALYKAQMPLLYDQCYLELSYLIRELERVPLQKWIDLVTHFSIQDTPDPKEVPVELAGACTVINAGRKSFEHWIQENHPSLPDDLWGQFWLAAVAVGLNFCNKNALSIEERLAGLIYSASHLKRYCTQFGVPLPAEVRLLYDAHKWHAIGEGESVPVVTTFRKDLPIQPTPFIGRHAELKAIKNLLLEKDVHLVTLTGPGGTGKTRMAIQVAADLLDSFPDGAFFIDLATVSDPESVFATIARTIGLRESSDHPLIEVLQEQLHDQKMMLILDNFEQVTTAAPKVAELIRNCPQLKVVVTSREALQVRGEQVVPIPPMGLPQANFKHLPVDQLMHSEAIQLFIERAREVKPDFKLTDENASTVVEICSRLDGLPLAIELATARISLFSPRDLLDRVGNRLKLLRGGAKDLPERQQTLRDTIDWSYDLLDINEQRLFALLSIFSGFSVEAVEEVSSKIKYMGEMGADILDELASLVQKSLIRNVTQGTGESRLMMLETIREYAAERLEVDLEFSNDVHRAHAMFFADFAQKQWEHLASSGRESVLKSMESEIENVQASWRYWVAESNLTQLRKLTDSLWLIYDTRGWYQATADLTNDLLKVLSSTESTPELIQEKILLHTSLARALLAVRGYTPEVEKAYTKALELSQESDEVSQLFPVLRGLYSFYTFRGEFDKGLLIGKQILDLAERNDDNYMRTTGYFVLGSSISFTGDIVRGMEYLDNAIASIDPKVQPSQRYQIGNYPGVSSYTASSMLLWGLGYPDRAIQRANEAVALAKRINHPYSLAYALFHNGYLRFWMREAEHSLDYAQAVLDLAKDHEFQIWTAVGICLQAACLANLGKPEEGFTLIQQGMDLYQGLKSPPIFWPLLRGLQAQICGLARKPEQGLKYIDESIAIPIWGYGKVLISENYRIKGNLMLAQFPDKPSEAEPWFKQALKNAQEQKASMLELRAAMSLTRLWINAGKEEQAKKLLSEIYERFTEGFSTIDLQEARGLLANLSEIK